MILEFHALDLPERIPKQHLAADHRFAVQLAAPLEGRKVLRHEYRCADRDAQSRRALFLRHAEIAGAHLLRKLRDAQHILVRFRGQADHEIQLYGVPALIKRIGHGAHQIILGHALVDYVAQALRTRFGRECQRRFAHLLGFLQRIRQHRVDALRRQRNLHPLRGEFLHHAVRQLRQTGIIAAGQAHQRNFIIARIFHQLARHFHQMIGAALAHGAIQHARLTEPAAARAAAEDFQHDAVVHDFAVGHDQLFRIIRRVQIGDHRLAHNFRRAAFRLGRDGSNRSIGVAGYIVQARHVDSGDRRAHLQIFRARRAAFLPADVRIDGLIGFHFAIADGKHIHKIRQRFGVERAGAAADHERIIPRAILLQKWNARQIQRFQNVGKAHFILERDAQQIELAYRRAALQREQRHLLRAHFRDHIHPRRENAFAPCVRALVDDGIQNAHAQMRHADFIGIRKQKGVPYAHVRGIFHHRAVFAAHIAHGLLYPRH